MIRKLGSKRKQIERQQLGVRATENAVMGPIEAVVKTWQHHPVPQTPMYRLPRNQQHEQLISCNAAAVIHQNSLQCFPAPELEHQLQLALLCVRINTPRPVQLLSLSLCQVPL
jgi:hypothetical protein